MCGESTKGNKNMNAKLTFLGSGSLFVKGDNFQSNMVLEINGKKLLIDAGNDVKLSLEKASIEVGDLDAIYITHLHGDHCMGLEYLGYYSYFISKKRPQLFIHESMINDLWASLRPSMERLSKDIAATLSTYFDVKVVRETPYLQPSFFWENVQFNLVRNNHIENYLGNHYSYGLLFGVLNDRVYISADTNNARKCQEMGKTTHIFHDCETVNISEVHAHYNDLVKMPPGVKGQAWLYHYQELGDKMPDAVCDGFRGFVKRGQSFEFIL